MNTSEHLTHPHQSERLVTKISPLMRRAAQVGAYGRYINEGASHQEALQQATENVARDHELLEINEADASFIDLLGRTGGFVEAQHQLDTYKQMRRSGDRLSDEQKEHMRQLKLEHAIPFNHSLKEFINQHPSSTIDETTAALTSAYVSLFQTRSEYGHIIDKKEAHDSLRTVVDGMRHEIAAETLLSAAGIEYDYEVSVEDDSRGRDLYVILGDQKYHIDIKSSLTAERRGRKAHPDTPIVWTGLKDADFTGLKGDTPGSLIVPFSIDQQKVDRFVQNIDDGIRYAQDVDYRARSR